MAKYIDADEAIEAVETIWEEYRTPILNGDVRLHLTEAVLIGSEVKAIIDGATKGIKCVPAADVVKVVRCEDCKHWREYIEDYPTCTINREVDGSEKQTKPQDYCSYGEHKDE